MAKKNPAQQPQEKPEVQQSTEQQQDQNLQQDPAVALAAAQQLADGLAKGDGGGNPETPADEQKGDDALPATILLVGGFEVGVRLAELLTEEDINVQVLESRYDEAYAAFTAETPDAFPAELPASSATLPMNAVRRYIDEVKAQGLDPEHVEFVIADPHKDPVLKSLNFLRSIAGQVPTFFYPRIGTPIEE